MKPVQPKPFDEMQDRQNAKADRRKALRAAGTAAIGVAMGGGAKGYAAAQEATPSVDTADDDVCVLTPQLTQGPFYLTENLIRQDITEGRAGVPLKLKIRVMDPVSCTALHNVAVDIWHCDALGYYSGVGANAPGDGDPVPDDLATVAEDNFLRGVQLTDVAGTVEFDTIYPGWYQGRAIHIHLKVHVDGIVDEGTAEEGDETYVDVHTAHTGQLFFDEESNNLVFALPPYNTRVTTRLANADDGILGDHADEPGFMLALSLVDPDDVAAGMIGTITLGIDPNAVSS